MTNLAKLALAVALTVGICSGGAMAQSTPSSDPCATRRAWVVAADTASSGPAAAAVERVRSPRAATRSRRIRAVHTNRTSHHPRAGSAFTAARPSATRNLGLATVAFGPCFIFWSLIAPFAKSFKKELALLHTAALF